MTQRLLVVCECATYARVTQWRAEKMSRPMRRRDRTRADGVVERDDGPVHERLPLRSPLSTVTASADRKGPADGVVAASGR